MGSLSVSSLLYIKALFIIPRLILLFLLWAIEAYMRWLREMRDACCCGQPWWWHRCVDLWGWSSLVSEVLTDSAPHLSLPATTDAYITRVTFLERYISRLSNHQAVYLPILHDWYAAADTASVVGHPDAHPAVTLLSNTGMRCLGNRRLGLARSCQTSWQHAPNIFLFPCVSNSHVMQFQFCFLQLSFWYMWT